MAFIFGLDFAKQSANSKNGFFDLNAITSKRQFRKELDTKTKQKNKTIKQKNKQKQRVMTRIENFSLNFYISVGCRMADLRFLRYSDFFRIGGKKLSA